MRVMSTSKMPCTCALVRFDITMCSAIFLRITDMGTTSPGVTPPIGCKGVVTGGRGGSSRRGSSGVGRWLQRATESQEQKPALQLHVSR